MNEFELTKRVQDLASQIDVVGQDVGFDKSVILNTITKQSIRIPLNVTKISPLTRKDVVSNMIPEFLNEQFVSQKLLPCTFYEVLSFSPDVHMLSIYETKDDAIHEMPPSYQFMFSNFKQKEIIEELGAIVTNHLVHVVEQEGDVS